MSPRPISLFFTLAFLLLCFNGISQSTSSSKWIIDKKTYFLSQERDTTSLVDTIIFKGDAAFYSELVTFEHIDSIIYNKRTKKLTVGGSKNGKFNLSKKIIPTILTPITEPAESFNFELMEYTVGDWKVYLR